MNYSRQSRQKQMQEDPGTESRKFEDRCGVAARLSIRRMKQKKPV